MTLDVPIDELSEDLIWNMAVAGKILDAASLWSGFTVDQLVGPRRTAPLAWARHLSMAAIRRATELSFPQIGRLYGRHHSSVMHAVTRIEAQAALRPAVEAKVVELVAAGGGS